MTEFRPTASSHDEDGTDPVTSTLAAAALEFPRIDLPPAPNFGLPRRMDIPEDARAEDDIPGLPPAIVPNVDEPATAWKSPFPLPEPRNSYAFQISPPADLTLPEPANSPWSDAAGGAAQPVEPHVTYEIPAPVPVNSTPTPARTATPPAPAPLPVTDPEIEVTGLAPVALAGFAALSVFLFWASGYAFSAALMALAALIASELAAALALARGAGQPVDAKARVVAGVSLVLAVLAARKGMAGFSADAFVGGLFVIVAVLPTAAVLGITLLALRRRASLDTAADHALRRGALLRWLALAAIAFAGYRAHAAWTARPDAIVALALTALAVVTLVPVLAGRVPGRLTRS